jgi:hypothetical protein
MRLRVLHPVAHRARAQPLRRRRAALQRLLRGHDEDARRLAHARLARLVRRRRRCEARCCGKRRRERGRVHRSVRGQRRGERRRRERVRVPQGMSLGRKRITRRCDVQRRCGRRARRHGGGVRRRQRGVRRRRRTQRVLRRANRGAGVQRVQPFGLEEDDENGERGDEPAGARAAAAARLLRAHHVAPRRGGGGAAQQQCCLADAVRGTRVATDACAAQACET